MHISHRPSAIGHGGPTVTSPINGRCFSTHRLPTGPRRQTSVQGPRILTLHAGWTVHSVEDVDKDVMYGCRIWQPSNPETPNPPTLQRSSRGHTQMKALACPRVNYQILMLETLPVLWVVHSRGARSHEVACGGVYCAVPNNPKHRAPPLSQQQQQQPSSTPLPTNPIVCKWEGSVHRRSIKTVISLSYLQPK